MNRRAIVLGILSIAISCGACRQKEPTLSLLVWEGYADPSFVRPFEESHHCKIAASYMGSSDELVAKLRGGSASNYDVISPSSDVATSIARALVNRPELLLLDEPLSALDANLRKEMQSELKALQREIGIAFLFVTHDQEEAMALSDRIALLRDGALEQVASPREIYARPATAYTAQFIGQTNLLRGEIRRSIATCGVLRWPLEDADGPALFSVRPEAIRISSDGKRQTDEVKFRGSVRQQIYSGASELLEVDCGSGQLLRVRLPARGPLTGEHDFVFSIADAIRVVD